MNKIVKDALVLTAITLISGGLLGSVYEITKEPIARQEELAKQEAYKTVLPKADSFKEVAIKGDAGVKIPAKAGYTAQEITGVAKGLDKEGKPVGFVYTVVTSEGYGGDITFTMGITSDGTVQGIEMLSISETAGLGMKAAEEDFKSQYANKKVEKFQYTKTGAVEDNEIDAISGATITTNAVTNGVNAGLAYFAEEGGMGNE